MPVYNGVEFFEDSYNSILKQTFKNWELLIGINGHEKKSDIYKFIKAKTSVEDRVRIYDLAFKGKSKTLNFLTKKTIHDYIAILDVDDLWESQKLEKQIPHLAKYDIVGTNCQYIGDMDTNPHLILGEINNSDFLQFNTMINSSAIIKKELCYWMESLPGLEDYELWLRLAKHNKKFFNLSDVLTFHRIHRSSHFNTKDFTSLEKELKLRWA
tara:strand:+ start:58 stop:693 length:636 start_codon:yes stop_codon:yes gene_type:complete